jgi:hypothetical protein
VLDIDHMGLLADMTRGREPAIHGLGVCGVKERCKKVEVIMEFSICTCDLCVRLCMRAHFHDL